MSVSQAYDFVVPLRPHQVSPLANRSAITLKALGNKVEFHLSSWLAKRILHRAS